MIHCYKWTFQEPPPTKKEREQEAAAFAAYRAEEESKKVILRSQFGYSRYHTIEEATTQGETLGQPYCIT
tara:strand:+ start:698 stop:907 length:210 start_codon:yes stop_codon:yes gene_type:complete